MAPGARVHDVIESLGFGKFQLAHALMGGGIWAADGAELLLIGSITRSLSKEWGLTAMARGTMVSVLYVGVMFGNGLSGMLGDKYGRRVPILLSYFLIVVFSALSACAWDAWSMTSARVLVGLAFGIGQPAWNAMSSEIAPTDHRIMMAGMSMSLFVVGELYATLLIWEEDPQMKDLKWRFLLILGATPSAVLGIAAYFGLHESATFLASKGRVSDARAVLDAARRANGRDVPIDFTAPVAEEADGGWHGWDHLQVVFGKHLAFPTAVTCLSAFTCNFIFYGGLYAFPQVFPKLDLYMSPVANLALGACMEIPGLLLGVVLAKRMTRKRATLLYLGVAVVCTSIFLFGAGAWSDATTEWAILVGFGGLKLCVNSGFLVVYLFSAELYPTSVRNTGTAVCIAAGRFGSITCPIVYEVLTEKGGTGLHCQGFFYVMLGLCLVNAVAVSLVSVETAGKQLDVVEMETAKLLGTGKEA